MSDLLDLKRILKKMMILNATRMAEIRNQPTITLAENADYEDRYKEASWLADSIGDIEESERLNAIGSDMSAARDTLKANIQRRLESRYDQILDKTRKLGAGKLPDGIITEEEFKEARNALTHNFISQEDRDFLGSCGIKAERGDTWLP